MTVLSNTNLLIHVFSDSFLYLFFKEKTPTEEQERKSVTHIEDLFHIDPGWRMPYIFFRNIRSFHP